MLTMFQDTRMDACMDGRTYAHTDEQDKTIVPAENYTGQRHNQMTSLNSGWVKWNKSSGF